ncbi:hypothetical protein TRFO_13384 [Tritrichomonas foetus]|uniref:Uncharacterized protein n=1 Tax=Tritrichomonas foetus TaxID=1144522 RepID=A0A1J4KYH8_9EUKA|nr:hypothetical protein TRFO_13384 [Tritrichomonas foetus]|eukprot:OHT16218.1 hypothetical protein TRFO_13384 [Tritrichomonas foetus]
MFSISIIYVRKFQLKMEEFENLHQNEQQSNSLSNSHISDVPLNQNSNEFTAEFNHQINLNGDHILEQETFLSQFTEFSPGLDIQKITFLAEEYKNRLFKNYDFCSSFSSSCSSSFLSPDIQNWYKIINKFYKKQTEMADQMKFQITKKQKLENSNLEFSMNNLSSLSKYFESYSSFRHFCVSSQIILENGICENPPFFIFLNYILLEILKNKKEFLINHFLTIFKSFSLIRRREILSIASNKLIENIQNLPNSIPLFDNSKEFMKKELNRISSILNIKYDLNKHDGQHFIYNCEKVYNEYQRLNFSFQKLKIEYNETNTIDCINRAFMMNHSIIHDFVDEAFENILSPSSKYMVDIFNSMHNKSVPSEQIQALVNLRFCRNKQLLLKLEKSTKKLIKLSNLIKINIFNTQLNEKIEQKKLFESENDPEREENKYLSLIIEQIKVFASAVVNNCEKSIDYDSLIETCLDLHLRFTKAKNRILKVLLEISKHRNLHKIIDIAQKIINRKPDMLFQKYSFFDKFNVQIETLHLIGKIMSLLLNIQIMNERQLKEFYGVHFEPFLFGSIYSHQLFGDFNTSFFEVFPIIEKLLDFLTICPQIVNEICSTMSIKYNECSLYIENAVWTQLYEEITQFPTLSIFGNDFTLLHFNMPVSDDIISLINCQLLDDPLFIKNFIKNSVNEFSEKEKNNQVNKQFLLSYFSNNLSKFLKIATKIRKEVMKTNLLIPIFVRQIDEMRYSVGSQIDIKFHKNSFNFLDYDKIAELCFPNSNNFQKLFDIYNSQKRYNTMLKIAIQYNNFRSDNYYSSFFFNISAPDNNFFITKTENIHHEKSDTSKILEIAANVLFIKVNDLINQDFSSIFYDISEIEDFSNPQTLFNHCKIYLNRLELAILTNLERNILFDFQQTDLFFFNREIIVNKNSLDYFAIPNISQCLQTAVDFESPHFNFDKLNELVLLRLKLISHVRFFSILSHNNEKVFEQLYHHELLWDSTFFAKMTASTYKDMPPDQISEIYKNCEEYQTSKLLLSTLQLLQTVFQTKKASKFTGSARPLNLSYIEDKEIQVFWKSINYVPNSKDNQKYFFSLFEKYVSHYLNNFSYIYSDKMKSELIIKMNEVNHRVDEIIEYSINSTDNEKYQQNETNIPLKIDIINKTLKVEMLKFVYLNLYDQIHFKVINSMNIVEKITRRNFRDNWPVYINNIVSPIMNDVPEEEKKSSEYKNLDLIYQSSIHHIKGFIIKKQKEEYLHEIQKIEQELDEFLNPHSPLKPECYIKKKFNTTSEKIPYNPNPEDANRQFEQEVRYARCRIILMLTEILKKQSSNVDQNNPESLNNIGNVNDLISKFIPLSKMLSGLCDCSKTHVLNTWKCYVKNMRDITFTLNEQDIFVNRIVRLIIERYNHRLNFELSVKISDQYLTLTNLKDLEKTIIHEHLSNDKEIEEEIRKEYEEQLMKIKIEQQKVLDQFPVVHDQYHGKFESVIEKQKKIAPDLEELLKPNHEFAQQSLQISKESEKELEEIKRDEKIQQEIFKRQEEQWHFEEENMKEEEKKRNKEIPNIDLSSMKLVHQPKSPKTEATAPRQHSTGSSHHHHDANKLSMQKSNSSLKLESRKRIRRKKMMVKSQTMQFDFQQSNSQDNSDSDDHTFNNFVPKKHISSVSFQRSQLLLAILKDKSKNEPELKANRFETDEKLINFQNEINNLRKDILKERIVRCLFRIGTSLHFKKAISKVADEKKEASMILWKNHRLFEEQSRELNQELEEGCRNLTKAEVEIENLRSELENIKAVTTKLSHWKEMNLRSSDEILKKIGIYQKGPNVGVNQLLKKIEEKQAELDILLRESEDFENELILEIMEPMEEMSRIKKISQQRQFEAIKMRKDEEDNANPNIIKKVTKDNEKMLKQIIEENRKYIQENFELKQKISELEKQIGMIPKIKLDSTKELFALNSASSARTSYATQKRRNTSLTARSPYANIGYGTIKKPVAP